MIADVCIVQVPTNPWWWASVGFVLLVVLASLTNCGGMFE